jgi:NADH-quinone oxidoreductase chain G
MIEIKINGLKRKVSPGLTIMQACEFYDITIPHFCYHDKLSIAGNCRMCLVEAIENPNNPLIKRIASCARNVAPGMEIYTNTAMVKKAREGVLEFLLANHPLDCPICDQGGECDLQDQSLVFGGDRGRFYEIKRSVEDKNCGPLIKTLMTRCIHCTRCIRFTSEVAGVPIMGTTGRGSKMEVGFYIERVLASELSGNVIDLCPVGALTSKPYAFTARSWELRSFNSIDLFDSVGSSIRVDVRGSNIMRILPRINLNLNEDWISDKVRFVYDGLKVQRLLSPFLNLNGSYVKVSWQKAFYFIRNFIFAAMLTIGTRGIISKKNYINFEGIAGNFVDAEALIAFKDLFNQLGSSNITINQDNARFDSDFRSDYLFNTGVARIEESDLCLLIATNPRLEAPTLNIKLRKLYLGGTSIYNLGFSSSLNYYSKSLGNSAEILIKILEGNHWFCQKLLFCEHPLIIVGSSFYQRNDSLYRLLPALRNLLQKSTAFSLSNFSFCDINTLLSQGNTVTGLDLNITPSFSSLNSFIAPISIYYLLGADDIYRPVNLSKSNLCIYQGHHGDNSVNIADVILPSVTYFERNSTYSSLEGLKLQTQAVFYSLGQARSDWKIIRALSDFLDIPLPYSSSMELKERLLKVAPFFKNNFERSTPWDNSVLCKIRSKLNVSLEVFKTPFKSFVNNFYLNDAISRSSKTMSLCSSAYNLKGRSF